MTKRTVLIFGLLCPFLVAPLRAQEESPAETVEAPGSEPANADAADESAESAEPATNETGSSGTESADPAPTNEEPSDPSGMEDLDEATSLKITAQGIGDINKVVDLLDSALEKGLDAENEAFAKDMLISSLIQRARGLSRHLMSQSVKASQVAQWMQLKQFALTDLQRAIGYDEAQWEAQMLIGKLQALPYGDIRAARRAFGKVIKTENVPQRDRAEAYALRGATFRDDPAKQLEDYTKALELAPDKPEYLRLRAENLQRSKQFVESLQDIDRALELEPEHAATHELRGMVLLGMENFDAAMQSFDKASELAPEALLPYQHKSELFRLQGDLNNSIQQLTKALELRPDDLVTLLTRSRVYFEADRLDDALADLDRAIEVSPGLSPALLKAYQMKAEILAYEERLDEAIATLKKVLDKAPGRSELIDIQYQLATYYLLAMQAQAAVDAFSQVITWDEDNVQALRGRGDAYLNLGMHAEAIDDFEKAVQVDEEDEGLLNNLAWVLATSPQDERRNGERAVELAKKACELSAYQKPHILSTLAAAHAELGDFEEAIKWSQQAVDLGKEDPSYEQLKNELTSYQDGKPWREWKPSEEPSEDQEQPAPEDQTVAPSAPDPTPARTADF